MEHNREKTIGDKIRVVEQNKVQWNKDAVWSKLSGQMPRKNRTMPFYYAAASVILLTISSLIIYQLSIDRTNEEKIKNLEELISQMQSQFQPMGDKTSVAELEACVPSNNNVNGKIEKYTSSHRARSNDVLQPFKAVPTNENLAISENIVIENTENPLPDSIEISSASLRAQDEIVPIVGFIEASDKDDLPSKARKRNKIKLMKASELLYTNKENSSNMIVARIK